MPDREKSEDCGDDRPPGTGGTPKITSEEILQGNPEVLIEHGDEVYRLRKTRHGKLILHK